jgi:ABC-type Na+ efflux pump permease subunit
MYAILLILHSLLRWLVLGSLLYATGRAYRGYVSGRAFTKTDNAVRHWTATLAHIQLMVGFTLYMVSPLVKAFFAGRGTGQTGLAFFPVVHLSGMFTAIVVISIGSALAKRRPASREQFKTMLIWFSVGLVIIMLAIPWPFSPLAARPYLRF